MVSFVYTGDTVLDGVRTEMLSSRVYSVMIDETTELRTTSQMIVYIKYIAAASTAETTRFLAIVPVSLHFCP